MEKFDISSQKEMEKNKELKTKNLMNIKSSYILKKIMTFIKESKKLKMIKICKKMQNF